jgi:hypothetical protein
MIVIRRRRFYPIAFPGGLSNDTQRRAAECCYASKQNSEFANFAPVHTDASLRCWQMIAGSEKPEFLEFSA